MVVAMSHDAYRAEDARQVATVRPPWYRRRALIIPVATGLLGIGVGVASGGSNGPAAAAPETPATTVTATSTVTSTVQPAAQPTTAPTVTRTVMRRVKAAPRTVRVTVTTTATAQSFGAGGGTSTYYANCSEARAAGAAPLYVGDPGYRAGLDRDGDGIACE